MEPGVIICICYYVISTLYVILILLLYDMYIICMLFICSRRLARSSQVCVSVELGVVLTSLIVLKPLCYRSSQHSYRSYEMH